MTTKTDQSTKILRKRFGAWLKECREATGMTQLDLGVRGLNHDYPVMVSQIERGASALPEHDLVLWAELLRVPVEEFGKKYLYYNRPFVYQAIYGVDPYAAEKLPRGPRTIRARTASAKKPARKAE